MRIEWLGLVPYTEAWELQKKLHTEVLSGGPERILLLEHPPVITLGKSAKEKNLLLSPERLKERGIELFRVDRGGDVTYHGPGQLVGYLILRVSSAKRLVAYVEEIIKTSLLKVTPMKFSKGPHAGVWIGSKKIASVGLAIKKGVSMHGFALNLTVDLAPFSLINPCGLPSSVMTTLEIETGLHVPPSEFYRYVVKSLEELKFDF
ncbi:MAG: lipoyl(octanoyl) transferase LipB [Thermotogae bacterium]|nr:lipoyl(octanoyl) transferase LipB [Thermotogota bacterium]